MAPPVNRQEARLEILRALSADVAMATGVELEPLAAATEGFTGADLKALLYNAQLEAVHGHVRPSSPHVGCRETKVGGASRWLTSSGSAYFIPRLHPNQELSPGSESDMSLSSMIFPNYSSASDDSVGDGDPGVPPDPTTPLTEPRVEERYGNVWRLYFGSSCESELGNSPLPETVSCHVFFKFFLFY